jgi:DNA polymerase III psi subunit
MWLKSLIILLCFLLYGCATNEPTATDWRSSGYIAELDAAQQRYKEKKISLPEKIRLFVAAAKFYFPLDALLARMWETSLDLALQLEAGKITPEEFDELDEKQRTAAQRIANQRFTQEQEARDREARIRGIEAASKAFQQSLEQSKRPAPVVCRSVLVGYTMQTVCQ